MEVWGFVLKSLNSKPLNCPVQYWEMLELWKGRNFITFEMTLNVQQESGDVSLVTKAIYNHKKKTANSTTWLSLGSLAWSCELKVVVPPPHFLNWISNIRGCCWCNTAMNSGLMTSSSLHNALTTQQLFFFFLFERHQNVKTHQWHLKIKEQKIRCAASVSFPVFNVMVMSLCQTVARALHFVSPSYF